MNCSYSGGEAADDAEEFVRVYGLGDVDGEAGGECALAVRTLVRPNDFVYLKGSAAVKLSLVLDALRAEEPAGDPVASA